MQGVHHKKLPRTAFSNISDCQKAERTFIQTDDPDKKLSAVHLLERSSNWRSCNNIASLGSMLVELSVSQEYSPDQRVDFISRGKEYLEQASRHRFSRFNSSVFHTKQLLANIGIFQAFAVDINPSRKVVNEARDQTIDVARQILTEEKGVLKHYSKLSSEMGVIRGSQAELIGMILLQRFEHNELGDLSYLTLPSHYSEDRSLSLGRILRSWDISVYTRADNDDPYELTYPVQIKSYRERDQKRIYDDSVVLVHIGQDLAFQPHPTPDHSEERSRTFPVSVMLSHIVQEYDGDASLTSDIDKRTQLLLEVLG